jgi:hypothetical protein
MIMRNAIVLLNFKYSESCETQRRQQLKPFRVWTSQAPESNRPLIQTSLSSHLILHTPQPRASSNTMYSALLLPLTTVLNQLSQALVLLQSFLLENTPITIPNPRPEIPTHHPTKRHQLTPPNKPSKPASTQPQLTTQE